jgi:hypothetical protein
MCSPCAAGALILWCLGLPGAGALGAGDGGLAAWARARLGLAAWQAGPGAWSVLSERFDQMSEAQLRFYLSGQFRRRPEALARLEDVSALFLGTPYVASPLGEGAGHPPDPDPLIRFDGVDCTTFVEQTLALSRSHSLPEALVWLRRIRYLDGRMDYRHRKHFMEAQWLPANQRLGLLEDITVEIAGRQVVWVERLLGPELWRMRRRPEKWPKLEADQIASGRYRLPVVPLSKVLDLQARLPAGTLVNVVRQDLPGYPTQVTHQGIVVERGGARFLRHAGRAGYGRVVDEPLARFVGRNLAYRKWVVVGFNLQRLIPDGHRRVQSRETLQ